MPRSSTAAATYEPEGPVSVDLLTLADGRVLGIDSDTAVVYPSMAFFEGFEGEPVDLPSIALVAGKAA